ncbi:MAG TPA: hypothetical protein PLX14_10140 [Anaerolineales bacterium]|nr:hypothetical protein [Anaerolineales bacterium]
MIRRILSMFVLALFVSACGSSQNPAGITGSWVGRVDGTDAFIAIASNGSEVLAYICDGQTITQWLHGDAGDKVDLDTGNIDISADGNSLLAALTVDSASGSITYNGQTYTFTAERAAGDAGLYRSEETINGENWVGGWVVLNDGQLRGMSVNLNTNSLQPQTTISAVAKIIDASIPRY